MINRIEAAETSEPILCWHFEQHDRRLPYGDGRRVEAGVVFTVDPPIVPCRRGLHGCVRPLDALRYAESAIVSRTEHSGVIVHHDEGDKLASSLRKHLWVADATAVLHEFACRRAERALTAAGVTDEHSWKAIEAKRAWVRGEISDEQLDAARAAAYDAAGAAAYDAAWAAAAAAWDAAAAAARDAAARDAARDAAYDAARAARAAAYDAARAAAGAAAYDAAGAEQNAELERLLLTLAPAAPAEGVAS